MGTQDEGNVSSRPIKVMAISDHNVCVVEFGLFGAHHVLDKVLFPMVWFSAHLGVVRYSNEGPHGRKISRSHKTPSSQGTNSTHILHKTESNLCVKNYEVYFLH